MGAGILGNSRRVIDDVHTRREKERLNRELGERLGETGCPVQITEEIFNHIRTYAMGDNYRYNIQEGEKFRHEATLTENGRFVFYNTNRKLGFLETI